MMYIWLNELILSDVTTNRARLVRNSLRGNVIINQEVPPANIFSIDQVIFTLSVMVNNYDTHFVNSYFTECTSYFYRSTIKFQCNQMHLKFEIL